MFNTKDKLNTILNLDLSEAGRIKRFGVRSLQILYASIRDLSDGQLSLQAMSLVYTTLITLVPLLAISFSVLKGFGVHNQIEPMLLGMLEGLGPEKSAEVTEKVIGFVDNIEVGVLGALGLGLLIYAVIALMQKIEAAFNHIWRVAEDRTFAQRFSDYLSVLLMGPLLIFLSAGFTTTVRNAKFFTFLQNYESLAVLNNAGLFLLPWVVMAAGFTFFYIYMPNTKVRISAAFVGGLVAALLWKSMGFAFSSFIASSANYVAIYAAFATLIILMIWLYASWLVILIGANISFYVQYPRYLRISREPLNLPPYTRMILGLSILTLITKSHLKNEHNWSIDTLSRELNAPILAIQRIIGILEDGGVLVSHMNKNNESATYYPAMAFDRTPLQVVIDVLEKGDNQGWIQNDGMRFPSEARSLMDDMSAAREKAVTSKTIAEAVGNV